LEQALAVYRRSLAVNQFQPHVQARVAILQTTVSGGRGLAAPAADTRVVTQPERSNRY
jgi:hypothetical protein